MPGNPVNIVFIGNFPYPYGLAATKRVQNFVRYLCSLEVRPKILVLRQGGEELRPDQLVGHHGSVYYKTIGYGLKLNPNLLYKLPLYFIHGCIALIQWRKKNHQNCLYCYNGLDFENLVFIIFARLLGYRIIFDIVEDFSCVQNELHFLSRLKNKSWTFLDKHIFKVADGIIVISKYLKDRFDQRNKYRIPIVLIPISAKCNNEPQQTKADGITRFMYSGSFGEKDDLTTLITAFENVQRKRTTVRLLLTGKGSHMRLVKHRIVADRGIQYLGYLSDAEFYQVLQTADVLCMTRTGSAYSNAGFPFKLGEYLATGKPVIASKVGDVITYLKDRKDAFLIEPGDVAALEGAMEYCIDNYDAAVKIGRNGMLKCKKLFNPDTNGKMFLELVISLDRNSDSKDDRAIEIFP